MRVYVYWVIHVVAAIDEGLDDGAVDFRFVEDAFVIEGDDLHVRFGRVHPGEDAADHMTRLEWGCLLRSDREAGRRRTYPAPAEKG